MAYGYFTRKLREKLTDAGFPVSVAQRRVDSIRNLVISTFQELGRVPDDDEHIATISSRSALPTRPEDSWRYTVEIDLYGQDSAIDAGELNEPGKADAIVARAKVEIKPQVRRLRDIPIIEMEETYEADGRAGLISLLEGIHASPGAWRANVRKIETSIPGMQRTLERTDLLPDVREEREQRLEERRKILVILREYVSEILQIDNSRGK